MSAGTVPASEHETSTGAEKTDRTHMPTSPSKTNTAGYRAQDARVASLAPPTMARGSGFGLAPDRKGRCRRASAKTKTRQIEVSQPLVRKEPGGIGLAQDQNQSWS